MELDVIDRTSEVQVVVLLDFVCALDIPKGEFAVFGSEGNECAVRGDCGAVEASNVLLEGDLVFRLVKVESACSAVPRGGDEVQGLFVFLRQELDRGDPVAVFLVQLEFGFALQVPVDDSVVTSNGYHVLLGRTQFHVQHVFGVAFQQFWADFREQCKFFVFLLTVSRTQLDGADESIPAGGECEAAVVGKVELLDEVSVFALALEEFAEVIIALVSVDNSEGLVSG